ncbi:MULTISPECIES: amidohydrolase [unclassified Dysgonomonas]|uniref:amidohydrolase n=1 Tax=unclassified Dysgonomonas TaxID=2630389 RepID=UPI0024738E60|nr:MULTISPECIES: amidohydrolase [unclassified Dysgonomonas]
MTLLIKRALVSGCYKDIYVEKNVIKKIDEDISLKADVEIDAQGMAVIPGLINAHTHAAMTLFRGFADDMPLMPWLEQKIWPNEAKLTDEDIYWGTKLACLEMIKSGTTCFFDMYYMPDVAAQAVGDMGIRAVISDTIFDRFKPELTSKVKDELPQRFSSRKNYSNRISFALGPHAIYTVSGQLLQWVHHYACDNDLLIHLHLAETETEIAYSKKQFGLTPVRYLHKLGVLSPRLVIAHGLYVDDEEIELLARYDVKVVHNPASNMKLASGYRFRYKEMKEAGVTIGLGTDGCSSSNNLDMIETMKLASLLGKVWRRDPEALPVNDMLQSATRNGADILRINAGRIEEGCLADLCLIDLKAPAFTPNFNFESNLVYAANGSCVDTVICDGKVVMQNRKVQGEDDILQQAARAAYRLMGRTR